MCVDYGHLSLRLATQTISNPSKIDIIMVLNPLRNTLTQVYRDVIGVSAPENCCALSGLDSLTLYSTLSPQRQMLARPNFSVCFTLRSSHLLKGAL